MVLMLILACMIVLYIIKLNANAEVIRNNCKTDSDAVNVKNGQKVFYKSREAVILLIITISSIVICLIFQFTNIGNAIIDYFSYDIYEPQEFNVAFYYIPVYAFVIREIIVQVKIGDFLYKYFNVKEPELEEGEVKTAIKGMTSFLYKKQPHETTVADRLKDANVDNDDTQNNNQQPILNNEQNNESQSINNEQIEK